MNKIEKFAIAMSELLFDLRYDDAFCTEITCPNTGTVVPDEFKDKILDDEENKKKIKEEIRLDIVHHLTERPDDWKNDKGEYEYRVETFDYAYQVDAWVGKLYENQNEIKTVWVCTNCGSDNVQAKMWVNVNTNKVSGEAMEDDDEYWCDDCEQHHSKVKERTMMPRQKIIGYQVEGHDGVGHHIMHPDMEASFCVYNLAEAKEMIHGEAKTGGHDGWQLLTIWTDDVEEPTIMFEGDPRL